jgi:hypothetical protein
MPRKKRVKPEREVIASFLDADGSSVNIEVEDEESECFGKGSYRKVRHIAMFNKALTHIANNYYFSKDRRVREKYERLIYGPYKKIKLVEELQLAGIDIGDRAGTDLVGEIQKAIKVFDSLLLAKKNENEGSSKVVR